MKALQEQVILITGSTDGLGRLVALQLARQGATVLLHGRDPAKGAAVLGDIVAASGNPKLRYYNADLASLAAVRDLALRLRINEPRLDVLVNNAGIGPIAPGLPRRLSADGNELLFAVNYLAGFLLARELLPLLKASVPARIVNVASIGQQVLDFDNLQLERDYDDARAYRQSKLAQILDTFTLASELAGSGVTANCLHPATLMDTKMVHDGAGYFPGVKSTTEQGAAALLNLICAPALDGISGRYYDGLQEARANEQAYDLEARRQLQMQSRRLCNII
ncbi:MAG: SDR family NAD(P)-dependent oxidoreductase [Pseudohongiellaceae bacterium]